MPLSVEDPEFLQASEELIQFYRANPEIAANDLLLVDLSDIQRVVLRSMWFQNYVMSIMCRGSGKTFINAVFACLKAMLYPGYRIGLLAPTFRQSKFIFDECTRLWQKSPILQAATERKPTQQSDNCYIRFKATGGRNGSLIQAVPLGDGTKIRGSRFFTIICDEFPHIPEDIFNMVIRPMAATVSDPMENVRRLAQERELLEKGLITEADLQEKAANQIIITSSGYFTFNHMYKLYCVYRDEMRAGNEKYAVYRVPYTLLPEGFLDNDSVEAAKQQMSSLEFQMEYMAAFIPDTDAFYKASLLDSCSKTTFPPQVAGSPEKSYCLGVDPARTEDSFAICILELGKPSKVVHAIELKKQSFPKMAAQIEELSQLFNLESIYMDAGGGGLAIKDILAENAARDPRGPILDSGDEIHLAKSGRHILRMCNFTSDFISESNFAALRLLEHRDLLFPSLPLGDEVAAVVEESWQTIQSMKQQMQMIELSETATGKHHFDVPRGEGHGKQKKDLYTSFMLAARAAYDLLWAEQMPESVLHRTGVVKYRDTSSESPVGDPALGQSGFEIPQSLRDKLEIAQDPEGFKKKLLSQMQNKRNVFTSSAAVLKAKPKKPSR